MSTLVSTGLVESVVRYCCLCMVVFYKLVTFAMQENIEERYAIKFCLKLNKSATETFDSVTEAYGDATLSRTIVCKWHKAFKGGLENVENDPRSGRPISSTNDQNVEVVRAVMAKECRMSVRMIAEETGLDKNAKRLRKRAQRVRKTLQTTGCCTTTTRQLTLRFKFENFWRIKTFPYFHILPTAQIWAPCDFYLFSKLKSKLKYHHFGTMENTQKVVTDELHTLTENDFRYCYDQWGKRWNHCVTSQGSYFEGDNL